LKATTVKSSEKTMLDRASMFPAGTVKVVNTDVVMRNRMNM
jgi:hypothetical protein